MTEPIFSTDVTSRALSKLLSRFQKPIIRGLLAAFTNRLQDLEDCASQVSNYLSIDNGVGGVQLNIVGNIVGRGRVSNADPAYRRAIRCQIAINRSTGLDVDIYKVFALSLNPGDTNTSWLYEPGNLNWLLFVYGPCLFASVLWQNINGTRPAGCSGAMAYSSVDVAHTVTYAVRGASLPITQCPSMRGGFEGGLMAARKQCDG